jgi:hypothetical protein
MKGRQTPIQEQLNNWEIAIFAKIWAALLAVRLTCLNNHCMQPFQQKFGVVDQMTIVTPACRRLSQSVYHMQSIAFHHWSRQPIIKTKPHCLTSRKSFYSGRVCKKGTTFARAATTAPRSSWTTTPSPILCISLFGAAFQFNFGEEEIVINI